MPSLQPVHSEFTYIWGKFDFLFYHCTKCSKRQLGGSARKRDATVMYEYRVYRFRDHSDFSDFQPPGESGAAQLGSFM